MYSVAKNEIKLPIVAINNPIKSESLFKENEKYIPSSETQGAENKMLLGWFSLDKKMTKKVSGMIIKIRDTDYPCFLCGVLYVLDTTIIFILVEENKSII